MNDEGYFMRKALALAERGRGTTSPNPMVGALVVDDEGVIVGRGAHRFAGGPHAEVVALEDAGPRARGATLYCTLEPCSHTGRTGPCAPLVSAAGIRRAVIAMADPNPLVDGRGLQHLRDRGIDVIAGVERDAAERQNAAFLTSILHRRPHVIAKIAVSVDGRIAEAEGIRTPMTGPAAQRRVHRQRAEVDAIAVGSGTILADDPRLTARGAYRGRALTRVIFDRRLRTPPAARVLSTLDAGPVIIVSTQDVCDANRGLVERLAAAGARVLPAPRDGLETGVRVLHELGISSLVLEGGATLHRAALAADIVDAIHIYVAPRQLGSRGMPWMDAGRFSWEVLTGRSARWLGEDVLVEGYVHGHR